MKTSTAILLMLLLTFFSLHAQTSVLAMSVEVTPPASDTTAYGVPIIDSTTQFFVTMHVILADLENIYQVHVKLGSALHGSQILSTSFDYNVNGTFGSTYYSQTGNSIELGLGYHAGMISFYAEVQIEKTDHSLEDAVLFSNN